MSVTRRQALAGVGTAVTTMLIPAGTAVAEDGEDDAGLRVAHASPDAPDVDVYVDGAKAVDGLAFGSVTDYLEVPTGEREVAVNVAGTDNTVFGPATLDLAAEDYTALARGEVGSDDTEFTVDLLEDTNGANIGDDEARVRAIHASPDAPSVDVTVNDDALTLFEGVSYGESSGYAVVGADTYEIEIRPASDGDDNPDPVFETDATLAGGSTYTAIAVGYLTTDDEDSDEPFDLLLSEDATAPPRGDGEGNGGGGRGRGAGQGD